MNIPQGQTADSVSEAVSQVTQALSRRFSYGCHTPEDIAQQCWLYALEALASGKFDPTRRLVNFLYRCVYNRLCNDIRRDIRRSDIPCHQCHDGLPCGEDGRHCRRYADWAGRNAARAAVFQPGELEGGENRLRDPAPSAEERAQYDEAVALIDENLPQELRGAYLRMRDGDRVPKATRDRVVSAVRDILGFDPAEAPPCQ